MLKEVSTRAPGGALLLVVSLAGAGCSGAAGEELGTERQSAIMSNAIMSNAIMSNAIMSNAIMSNAIMSNAIMSNAIMSNAIMSNAISATAATAGAAAGDITDPGLVTALEDPYAQVFMKYMISCALEPGQQVSWTSRFTGQSVTWHGQLAMCPEWLVQAPSDACQERVSACILARNNAFGEPVQFSMRGHDASGAIVLGAQVPQFAWKTGGVAVASHAACGAGEQGEKRDCGWDAGLVGTCTPGDLVDLDILCGQRRGGPPDGVFRLCDGQNGCDFGDAAQLNSWGASCMSNVLTSFKCPDSGQFSLMTGHQDSAQTLAAKAVGQDYPAAEVQVFRWREGAFYGNIFGAKNLAKGRPEVRVHPKLGYVEEWVPAENMYLPGRHFTQTWSGVAFPSMSACWSDNWAYPDAYILRRVCAGPNQDACLAQPVGPCGQVCATEDDKPIAGDFDFQSCSDGRGHSWQHALTPVLAAPCDMMPGDPACLTVSPSPELDW